MALHSLYCADVLLRNCSLTQVMSLYLQVSGVPCWMFLGWLSQMTAILDKPESMAVHDLLVNIAQQYPQVCRITSLFHVLLVSLVIIKLLQLIQHVSISSVSVLL